MKHNHKITIQTIRMVCKLLNDPTLSQRSIAAISGISRRSVARIQSKLALVGVFNTYNISDNNLAHIFETNPAPAYVISNVDWVTLHADMQKRDMTLQLAWEEYRSQQPTGISYTTYCRQYRQWRKTMKVSLRQTHRPGESIFIDFCGRTMPIRDKETGNEWKAHVFVGVLGASGYLFAVAVNSQKVADFISAHIQMLNKIDGVPKYIVTDNLKSAVIKNTKEVTELNRAYAELAEYYGFMILPARPRKPKDKALAEVGVQIVQRWVLARLRNQIFFSLDELNEQIAFWMAELNKRITKTYTVSRSERLETIDRPALQPLPDEPYQYSSWIYNQRVDDAYYIEFKSKQYSVPYQFAHRWVDIRATHDRVDVFWQRERIASHAITDALVTSDASHAPDNHIYANSITSEAMLEWATKIGMATQQFVEANLADKRHRAAKLKSLTLLKSEIRQKGWQSKLEQACIFVIQMRCFSVPRLRAVLARHAFEVKPNSLKPIQHDNVRGASYFAKKTGGLA